jgi:methyl-accepting chemotaxis protein
MRGNAGGIAASARALDEIEGGLSGLRDEFGRLASGTAGQAQTLSSLLEEQASIATGLSQVARDISTISMRTAQRQDEVSRDVGTLIERLERVVQGLARGAGVDVEEPAPPGRLDPERLWPRRRS